MAKTSPLEPSWAEQTRSAGRGENRPLMERLRTGADVGQAAAGAKDAVSTSWNRLKGGAAALWDAYKRPPKWSDYEDATGKWSGAEQANALDLDRFTRSPAPTKGFPPRMKTLPPTPDSPQTQPLPERHAWPSEEGHRHAERSPYHGNPTFAPGTFSAAETPARRRRLAVCFFGVAQRQLPGS